MARITTKTGDKGTTGLCNGERVAKDDMRIEMNGMLDELNAWLGLVKIESKEEERDGYDTIQQQLMRIMGIIAGFNSDDDLPSLKASVEQMETYIELHRDCEPFAFVRPGTSRMNALLHVARTKARTCERRFVTLVRTYGYPVGIGIYLNRLSDYLFVKALAGE